MAVRKNLLLLLSLFLFVIVTRLPLAEKMHSHTDSPSLVLALSDYNLSQQTPAAPGYPVYLALGKVFNLFLADAHLSLILVSVFSTFIGAIAFLWIGKLFGGKTAGYISLALFLSSPSMYFFGLTIYPYLLMIALEILLVALCFKIVIKHAQLGLFLGCIYALLLGIRPQEVLVTFPIVLFAFTNLSKEEKLFFTISFFAIIASWLVPLVQIAGGLSNYINFLKESAGSALPLPSLNPITQKKFELANGLFLTLGFSFFVAVWYLLLSIKKFFKNKKLMLFCILWFSPSLIFNLFVRTEHAGYQAGYLSFGIVLVAIALSFVYSKQKKLGIVVILFLILSNLIIFFYNRDPFYKKTYRQSSFHYTDIVRNDYVLKSKVDFIRDNYSKDSVVIVAGPYFWRHVRYYLPEYRVLYVDALYNLDVEHPRVTYSLNLHYNEYPLDKLDIPNTRRIVLFDDESEKFTLPNREVTRFKGITSLTSVKINELSETTFSYKKISMLKKK